MTLTVLRGHSVHQFMVDTFILLDTMAHLQMNMADASKMAEDMEKQDLERGLSFAALLIRTYDAEKLSRLP